MNVLIITNSAWDDKNSLGNTLSNWFTGWDGYSFSCITYRSDIPHNKCCSEYFVVSPMSVVRGLFSPKRIGSRYNASNIPTVDSTIETKVKGITGIKRYIVRFLVELVYMSPVWRNKKYKQFLQDINPNVVFLFAIADSFVYENVKYIKKHTNAKIVMTVEDDVFGSLSIQKDLLTIIKKRRLKKMFKIADKLYGASNLMCDAYSKQFNRVFTPIYKGCEFHGLKQKVNNPIEMVYAGNLLYGRLNTLSKIAEAIRKINHNGVKMRLSIYSGTKVSEDKIRSVNDGQSAIFCGIKPFEQIKRILSQSDITLHVESFESDMQRLVRYSFSTKIIDCLQSGNTMMVVGPSNIASVEYPRNIPGAIVVDNTDNLFDVLNEIANNPQVLIESAQSINRYAREHHDINNVRNQIRHDFEDLIE